MMVMRVALELPVITPAQTSGTSTVRNSQERAAVSVAGSDDLAGSAAADAIASFSQTAAAAQPSGQNHAVPEQLNLSFRKDNDGKLYYVVTDEQTGQVVREVPPEAVRHVGDGIAEYLKAQAALNAPKTDTTA